MADLLLGSTVGEVGEPLAVESDDLTTHGVIVGMTGSGKTGLGIVLLEETLLAGVPALILDPKGDMGNLLLTFPDLAPADFRPWVSEDDARAAGLSVDELATKTAADWEAGLKEHGIGPDRIRALRDEVQEIDAKWREVALAVDTVTIRPESADVSVDRLALVWVAQQE